MRSNNKFILFVFFCAAFVLKAQNIEITLHDIVTKTASLYSLQGEKTFLINSVTSGSNNNFRYTFNYSKTSYGIYRFSFSNNKVIDFIYDGEDTELQTNANDILV